MDAYIYDAIRTPRGKGKKDGALYDIRPVSLLSGLMKEVIERNRIDSSSINDVIAGCVTQIGEQSGDIAKAAVLAAGYSDSVAGVSVNRFCGSGLEAVNLAAAMAASGQYTLILAGGVESMSRIPMGADGSFTLTDPEMIGRHYIVPQGISADLMATLYGYSRSTLDEFAARSHRLAMNAWSKNFFSKSVVPVKDLNGHIILDRDETIRPDTTVESLSKLKLSFVSQAMLAGFDSLVLQKYPEIEELQHFHHAGNSSGIVDGAALVLIGSKKSGEEVGLKPRAIIKAFAVTGSEPTIMLTGPAPAASKALKNAGMSFNDIDLFEVNEAFAVVPLRFIDHCNIDPDKVNVNGGAIAMGHPLGATGAILTGTLLDELERNGKSTGMITLCIGGGMGIATIIERI
jgi:acetyl-CoA C-acetyltransferase